MKKHVLWMLALLAMLSLLLCAPMASAAQADCLCGNDALTDTNNPCVQGGHQAVTWTDWSNATAMPTQSGNYRLTTDVNLSAAWIRESGNFVIDLAGHKITQTTANQMVFSFGKSASATAPANLTITDSVGGGELVGAAANRLGGLTQGSTLNIYGGTLNASACTAGYGACLNMNIGYVNMYGGTIKGGSAANDSGGGSIIVQSSSIFNLYGGTITGGRITNTSSGAGGNITTWDAASVFNQFGGSVENGGAVIGGCNVYVRAGTYNLKGGSIGGGSCKFGGSIYVASKNGGFVMTGGTVQGGTVTQGGGAIEVDGGIVSISGGTVKGGTAQYGGAINMRNSGSVTLSGTGIIDGGQSSGSGGGAVIIQGGTFTMNGGTIKNGKAHTGSAYGGNVFVFSGTGKFVLNGGTVEAGNAKFGGNIFANNQKGATVEIHGGTVKNGVAPQAGGNIYMYNNSTFLMTGGTITGGSRSATVQENIMFWSATATISGGTIEGYITVQNSTLNLSGNPVICNTQKDSGFGLVNSKITAQGALDGANVYVNGMDVKIMELSDNANDQFLSCLHSSSGGTILREADGIYIRPAGSAYGCVCGLDANGKHFGNCDGTPHLWTGWTSATTLPTTTGYYILNDAVALTEVMLVADGANVVLDLNGQTVTGPTSDAPKYTSWRIYDFNAPDKTKSLTITDTSADNSGKMVICEKSNQIGGIIWVRGNADSSLNIYGGTFDATGASLAASTIEGRVIAVSKGTMNLFDGTIDATGLKANYGTAITTYGAKAFNMTGGTIIGGIANEGGAALNMGAATASITGGKIVGGTAKYGGAINISNNCVMTLGGTAIVEGGQSTGSGGGNIIVQTGTLNITSGTVKNGKAHTGSAYGGNILAFNKSSIINITGGTIEGGEAKYGGNIFINHAQGATVSTSNCQILDGLCAAEGAGGNIYAYTGSTLNIGEGTVIRGGFDDEEEGNNLFIYNATVNMTGGTIAGYVHHVNGGTLTLAGAPVIYDEEAEVNLELGGNYKLTFTAPLTEGAKIGLCNNYTGIFTEDGCEAYLGYFVAGEDRYIEATETGALKAFRYVAQVFNGTEGGEKFITVAEAIDATTGYIKLIAPVVENVTVNGNVYMDFNGYTLTGDLTGEGTLYGMDSATDDYTTDTMGRITGKVSCKVAGQFKTKVTGATRRYMAIADKDGYTFHRFYMGITHINLKPGVTGVGYKAVFCGDEQVQKQIAGYGYTLWIGENGKKLSVGKDGAFESGKTITARLQNFDVANYGETPIFGQVYLTLNDGTIIESSAVSYSFRALLESINNTMDAFEASQLQALKTMCSNLIETVQNWNIANILAWEAEQN